MLERLNDERWLLEINHPVCDYFLLSETNQIQIMHWSFFPSESSWSWFPSELSPNCRSVWSKGWFHCRCCGYHIADWLLQFHLTGGTGSLFIPPVCLVCGRGRTTHMGQWVNFLLLPSVLCGQNLQSAYLDSVFHINKTYSHNECYVSY